MKIKVITLIFSCFIAFNIFSKSLSFIEKEKLTEDHFLSLGPICGVETFTNSNASASYTNGSFIGNDGVVWNYENVRNESSYPITAEGLILRNETSKITSSAVIGGIGDFTCSLLKGFTGAGDRQVELFINGVSKGTSIAWDTTNVQTFKVLNIDITGDVIIEIRNISGKQLVIDDVSWTCYTGTPAPEIQLLDTSLVPQNCGFQLDFNQQAIGATKDIEFSIKNSGTENLAINSLAVTGDYTIVSPTIPFSITPNTTELITVRFSPLTVGVKTETLTINSNDENESVCLVNLIGEGFNSSAEIDVERSSTYASIPNGSNASIGYNTIFATTKIGNTSIIKTYYIKNQGTSDLTITSINSSNNIIFPLTTTFSTTVLTPGSNISFDIAFSPNIAGTVSSIITIENSDSDEGSYTFTVQGTGNCAALPISISPVSGSVGTVVTVTGSNFGSSTSAKFNGEVAVVNVISSSIVEVVVPIAASTGSLVVTTDLGCESSEFFTVINGLIGSCETTNTNYPLDLFISEITDKGTGSHSYIEIFNGTGSAINLDTYDVRIHNNGVATSSNIIPLSGTINNNSTILIGFGGAEATDAEGGYVADFTSGISGINDNDNIRIYKNGTWIDLWGETTGNVFTIADNNYVYRRKNKGIIAPSITWNNTDWESFLPVKYDDIDNFDFSLGQPPQIISQPTFNNYNCSISTILMVQAVEGYVAGNNLSYEWYYNIPGNTGWTLVVDDVIYNNSNTNELTITNTQNLEGYQYYCLVKENDNNCSIASNAVKLLVDVTVWDGANWIGGLPNISKAAVINGDYNTSVNGSFSACSLVLNSAKKLTVTNSTFVEVYNNTIINGELVVETQAAFIQNNDIATFTLNTGGNALVNKTTAPLNNWYDYTYWSSPVVNETVETALSMAPADRKYYFEAVNFVDLLEEVDNSGTYLNNAGVDNIDDNGDDWQIATGIMTPAVGYAATGNATTFVNGATNSTQFKGVFNTGILQVPIVNNSGGLYNDWNFIGNPYAGAIDAQLFFVENSLLIAPAIYLWSHATAVNSNAQGNYGQNFSNDDYAIITGSGTNIAGASMIIPSSFVPSGQGFFIEAIASGNVTFTNKMRTKNGNTQFFKTTKKTKETANKIWVNLTSNNGVFNQTAVAYIAGATNNNDGSYYDLERKFSATSPAVIYSKIENSVVNFAIQSKQEKSLGLEEIISLGFTSNIDQLTSFTLSIAQFQGGFFEENTVYLKDNLLNRVHNLSASNYNFTSKKGVFDHRFKIVFNNKTLGVNNAFLNEINVNVIELNNSNVKFIVDNSLNIKTVEIYDVLGRNVHSFKGMSNSETYTISKVKKAIYFAKITLSNNKIVIKKLLKKN